MRAVGYQRSLPIDDPASLVDIEIPRPAPSGRDLLVSIKAVSVNPVDTKVRRRAAPPKGEWKILGWDAAGGRGGGARGEFVQAGRRRLLFRNLRSAGNGRRI